MSQKHEKIEAIVDGYRGRDLDAYYLAYFGCFNRQLFFEAHEVLEVLWLGQRQGPNGAFYKGLIQLAGGFVHLQKNRPGPAGALFKLAQSNLKQYPGLHEQLELGRVHGLIGEWLSRLAADDSATAWLVEGEGPELSLQP